MLPSIVCFLTCRWSVGLYHTRMENFYRLCGCSPEGNIPGALGSESSLTTDYRGDRRDSTKDDRREQEETIRNQPRASTAQHGKLWEADPPSIPLSLRTGWLIGPERMS